MFITIPNTRARRTQRQELLSRKPTLGTTTQISFCKFCGCSLDKFLSWPCASSIMTVSTKRWWTSLTEISIVSPVVFYRLKLNHSQPSVEETFAMDFQREDFQETYDKSLSWLRSTTTQMFHNFPKWLPYLETKYSNKWDYERHFTVRLHLKLCTMYAYECFYFE